MAKQRFNIKISGMSCAHCVNTVQNLVEDERGVESIKITLESGMLEVEGNEKMNKDQIIKVINLSGVYHAE